MPNRIIKESICTSDTIDSLSWFEEVFFYRLLVNADDYGRFDARPAILKARLFPLKANITDKIVEQTLNKLATVGLVSTYMVEDKPILQLLTWEKHQTIRNQKSKYPGPDEGEGERLKTVECNCNQLNADVPVIQSNPNPNPIHKRSPGRPAKSGVYDGLFDQFWESYPRKTAKAPARKAFEKQKPDEKLLGEMLKALDWQRKTEQWMKDSGSFIPHASTWLNQRRWEDEKTTVGLAGKEHLQSEDDFIPWVN